MFPLLYKGVILYAMLAGNLPFGKDILNCPRFRKYCEWINEYNRSKQDEKVI